MVCNYRKGNKKQLPGTTIRYLHDVVNLGLTYHLIQTETPFHNSQTGYGNKIPTQYMVKIFSLPKFKDPNPPIWRRVYAIHYSNVASHYIIYKGERLFLNW